MSLLPLWLSCAAAGFSLELGFGRNHPASVAFRERQLQYPI